MERRGETMKRRKRAGMRLAHTRDPEAYWLIAEGTDLADGQEIRERDLLLVEPNAHPENGDCVLVCSDQTIAVRRLYQGAAGSFLQGLGSPRAKPEFLSVGSPPTLRKISCIQRVL
jgi:SOS-response transcriptional repressor LexA